ncbi:hypothetical protein HJG54_14575 [Leptolyngbya sp. NK1-12]|uniref:Peptidase C-terminal archaeal/bacterial domain-containing protein n=1 Tax=Leptolyngbya sp. NK1-12 TaxID=2547451 RepID=A0AA97AKV2_9CYAN|nr:PPC domain-containing protein [Leptolyngbya sp. NK1-12]WNZ23957.1 hypothetical protein HJG54_14575 [Leptolyngbya sp. NK1-12]
MLKSLSHSGFSPLSFNRGVSKEIRGLLEKDKQPKAFRVRFAARSNLIARLGNTRFNTNVNLELLDSTGETVIAASRRLANRPELIEVKGLAPGTYFLRPVLARGKWSRFRLRANTTPIPDSGNTASTPRFLDLTSTPTQVGEFIGAEDRSDYYAFSVGGFGFPTGQLSLALTGENSDLLTGNVTIKIRDSSLRVVRQRTSNGRIGFRFEEPLAAGNYFIQVEPANPTRDETNYQLTLSTTAIPDRAGNTPNAAQIVSLDASNSLFQDFVGIGDQQDYYKFTVPKSRFNLRLTGPNGNLLNGEVTLRLRDNVNTILEEQKTAGSGAGLAIENKTLAAGTYIVQVSTTARFVNYSLVMAADPS